MEDTVSNLINEVIPKVSAHLDSLPHSSTAPALIRQMDFTKASIEEIRKHFTDLINPYEVRLESVDTEHFDVFPQASQEAKKAF